MPDQFTLDVKNSFAAVHTANQAISEWLTDRRAPAEILYFATLAIEEFGTNLIKYGYRDNGEHVIEIRLSLSAATLALTIIDDGCPFNPLDAPAPNLSGPIEERPIGGLGIFLVRRMSDRMDYVREDNKNKLTLEKAFHRGE